VSTKGLARATELPASPALFAGPALHLVAAARFPFDIVLSGMVAAGQGLDALCLFLSLSRDALFESLVRLGLQTPHDRPMRKPGARGWSVPDTLRLIAWRMAGIHPETIGLRLGRSANGVRAKARRLGLPVPDRKLLRRVDPATLSDPQGCSRFLRNGIDDGSVTRTAMPVGKSLRDRPSIVRSASHSSSTTGAAMPALPVVGAGSSASAASKAGARGLRPPSQRELPVFGLARPTQTLPTPSSAQNLAAPAQSSLSDIAWVGACRRVETNEVAIMGLSMRYFGGQNWKHIAADAGMSPAALRSVLSRIGLPRDPDRKKFGPTHDPECARATLEQSGFRLERDNSNPDLDPSRRPLFWKHKRDRGVTTNRATRFRRGQLGEYDKYKSEPITLVTRAELHAPRFDFSGVGVKPTLSHPAFHTPFATASPTLHP